MVWKEVIYFLYSYKNEKHFCVRSSLCVVIRFFLSLFTLFAVGELETRKKDYLINDIFRASHTGDSSKLLRVIYKKRVLLHATFIIQKEKRDLETYKLKKKEDGKTQSIGSIQFVASFLINKVVIIDTFNWSYVFDVTQVPLGEKVLNEDALRNAQILMLAEFA